MAISLLTLVYQPCSYLRWRDLPVNRVWIHAISRALGKLEPRDSHEEASEGESAEGEEMPSYQERPCHDQQDERTPGRPRTPKRPRRRDQRPTQPRVPTTERFIGVSSIWILLPPRRVSERIASETALDDLQVDLAYAALDVDAQGNARVHVRVVLPLEPLGVDLAQATLGIRLNPNRAGQQYRCLPHPALYAGPEGLRVITREIHRGLACPHLKIEACQGEAVEVQITLSCAHLDD